MRKAIVRQLVVLLREIARYGLDMDMGGSGLQGILVPF